MSIDQKMAIIYSKNGLISKCLHNTFNIYHHKYRLQCLDLAPANKIYKLQQMHQFCFSIVVAVTAAVDVVVDIVIVVMCNSSHTIS